MAVVRVHSYTVDPANLPRLIAMRADLIAGIRVEYPGLVETRLTRLEDGTFTDTWRWESFERMAAARPAASSPEAQAVMRLTSAATAINGEIIDERTSR